MTRPVYRTTDDMTQHADETVLIDQGLTRGINAMTRTYGIDVLPVGYDALAVGLIRFLQQQPAFATPAELIAGLNRRAVTLARLDQEVA